MGRVNPMKKHDSQPIIPSPWRTGNPVYETEPNISLITMGDGAFQAACAKAGVNATSRQASKWRNKKGSAWKAVHKKR